MIRPRHPRGRARTPLAVIALALAALVALPVSQLRLVAIVIECCCPDPERCHCPPGSPDSGSAPQIKPCHQSAESYESASAPGVTPVARIAILAPARVEAPLHHQLPTPHAPPIPDRPRGPS